jgi:hypothetical protein
MRVLKVLLFTCVWFVVCHQLGPLRVGVPSKPKTYTFFLADKQVGGEGEKGSHCRSPLLYLGRREESPFDLVPAGI